MRGLQGARAFITIGLLAWPAAGCSDSGLMEASGADGDDDAASSDSDTDSDVDGDADSDSDTDPPEQEEAVDYKVPKGSGRYVFIADETHGTVVVVDSETLGIRTAAAGSRPTHLVPLGADANAAAVINLDSDDLTIVRVADDGALSASDIPTRPDTNALAASADGEFVTAWFDPLFSEDSGAPGTDQDVSVVDAEAGMEEAFHLTVGMHPSRVSYNEGATRGFVVTEEGISVIDLMHLDGIGLPPLVPLFDPVDVDPASVEIAIAPDGSVALARADELLSLKAAWLDGSGETRDYALPAPATDLDIAPDGTWGLAVIRSLSQVLLFDLPLPADPLADPFEIVDLGGALCGLAEIAPDGETVLLYTTTGGVEHDRRLLTRLRLDGDGPELEQVLLSREIRSVAPGADSTTAVVMHQPVAQTQAILPYAYSLVGLAALQVKLQQLATDPGQLLLTPDGDFGFLLLRDDEHGVREVAIIDLETFIVDGLELGSPPTALGYATVTDKVFVAQEHPAGRMTFVGVHDGTVQTVTGYTLNDEITE
jgi:hypothetical protein